MKVYFIKRNFYTKDDKQYYNLTTMYEDIVTTSLVDKYTYEWFENAQCGDEIPADYCKLRLYQTKDGIKASIKIEVD